MNALDYILKANLYGLLFVSCYWLLLRRHTFFTLNRAYLLASVILSLILPLTSLPAQTVEADWPVPVGVIALPVTAIATMPVETGPDWEQIALLAYGFIAFALLLRLAIRVGRLLRFIQKSPRQVYDDYVLIQAPMSSGSEASTPTFSFFRYLVLSPEDVHNELILRHELVHIRQGHSVDVLALALLRAVFWVSPSLWLIDRMLRQVHEFLADKQASHPTVYARFLVEYAFGNQTDTLTKGFFNPSLLKQRILMLHQRATNRWALGKYVLVLPLAFGLLAMTTAREEIAAVVGQVTEETITVSGRVTNVDGKALPGANVVIANTGEGTPTDQNGFYKLENVSVSATLAYSHIGYRTDILLLKALSHRAQKNQLTLSPRLTPNLQDELPPMGASAVYKAIKLNPAMPVRTPPTSDTVHGKVLTAVEEPAVFPTGIIGLMQYVAQNLRYPTKAKATDIQGDVYVMFTIQPTGTIGDVKVNKNIKRLGGGCEEEAIRVVSQMPKWIPATQNGKTVAVRYQIPIQFSLEKKEDKRTGQVDPAIFKPTGSLIGEFPTMRDANYPNQPYLTMTKVSVPASSFKADTLPQSGLMPKPTAAVTIRGRGPLGELGPPTALYH